MTINNNYRKKNSFFLESKIMFTLFVSVRDE